MRTTKFTTSPIEKLSFIAEYFDPQPQVTKKYLLRYYPESNDIEMKDISTGRKFLSRSKLSPSLSVKDFVIGGRVVIFSRDIKLVDYGDNETRFFMLPSSETCIAFLLPRAVQNVEKIISFCENKGLTLVNMKSFLVFSNEDVSVVTRLLQTEPAEVIKLCNEKNNDSKEEEDSYCICMEFRGEQAVHILSQIEYKDDEKSGVIVPSTCEQFDAFKVFFLEKKWNSIAKYKNINNDDKNQEEYCCCVIKPHAIKSYLAGEIISDLKSRGFKITAMQAFIMDRNQATEFYEVYKGIKEYHGEFFVVLFLFCLLACCSSS